MKLAKAIARIGSRPLSVGNSHVNLNYWFSHSIYLLNDHRNVVCLSNSFSCFELWVMEVFCVWSRDRVDVSCNIFNLARSLVAISHLIRMCKKIHIYSVALNIKSSFFTPLHAPMTFVCANLMLKTRVLFWSVCSVTETFRTIGIHVNCVSTVRAPLD